jgi:predicted enzyme related to lactoylglutathione lyase
VYEIDKIEVNLTVPSIEETTSWYERVLGWSGHCDVYDEEGRCGFGSVVRGEMATDPSPKEPMKGFNLARFGGDADTYSRQHGHWTAFIKVNDVDAVYARVLESGMMTDGPPQDQSWGGRLFSMCDLNGFHLTFYTLVEEVSIDEIREPTKAAGGHA